jgi:hypothetical protein
MHGEFLLLLFLQAHRETEAHFTATGMASRGSPSLPAAGKQGFADQQGSIGIISVQAMHSTKA